MAAPETWHQYTSTSPLAINPCLRHTAQRDTQSRLDRVADLIEGFETPYGMELLASVHRLAAHEDPQVAKDPDAAVNRVHAWSEHKRQTFRPEHIKVAWSRLKHQGWF